MSQIIAAHSGLLALLLSPCFLSAASPVVVGGWEQVQRSRALRRCWDARGGPCSGFLFFHLRDVSELLENDNHA